MIMSWHQAQHTPSTAYTEYSIHLVQRTPSTAFTEYCIHRVQHLPKIVCLPFILKILSWPLNVASASGVPTYTFDHHQPNSPWQLKGCVTFSQSHGCELTNSWNQSQHPPRRPSTASKFLSKLATFRLPSSHNHGFQMHLQTHSNTASKLARSRPPSAYLQTGQVTASKCISKLSRSWPPSVSPNSRDDGHQSPSPNPLDHDLAVYLWVHLIIIFRFTTNCSQPQPAASPDIPCVDG